MMGLQARVGEVALEFVRVFANFYIETGSAFGL